VIRVGHVTCDGEKGVQTGFGQRTFRRPRRRWEDGWILLIQVTKKWRNIVNTEMNFLAPKTKDGEFLEQLSNFSLLKKDRTRWRLLIKQAWNRAHGKFDTKLLLGANGRQKISSSKRGIRNFGKSVPCIAI